MSENNTGKLTVANNTLKTNLKNWITHYKMISDTIDILDAQIVNFAIEYEIMIDLSANRYNTINLCNARLVKRFSDKHDIGEAILISDIYNELNKVPGVVDTTAVEIKLRSGGLYSESSYNFPAALTGDSRKFWQKKMSFLN